MSAFILSPKTSDVRDNLAEISTTSAQKHSWFYGSLHSSISAVNLPHWCEFHQITSPNVCFYSCQFYLNTSPLLFWSVSVCVDVLYRSTVPHEQCGVSIYSWPAINHRDKHWIPALRKGLVSAETSLRSPPNTHSCLQFNLPTSLEETATGNVITMSFHSKEMFTGMTLGCTQSVCL